jgi:hypothetical protein
MVFARRFFHVKASENDEHPTRFYFCLPHSLLSDGAAAVWLVISVLAMVVSPLYFTF